MLDDMPMLNSCGFFGGFCGRGGANYWNNQHIKNCPKLDDYEICGYEQHCVHTIQ